MTNNLSEAKFCPTLYNMLTSKSIDLPGITELPIHSTSTINNIRTIRQLLINERPIATLEIGLAFGASALTFLATHKEIHSSQIFSHTAIDPFQASDWKSAGLHAIQSAGLMTNFTHIEQDSALALPTLCSEDNTYGLIYVDGSHIFENVFVDFFYCARLLSLNGLILFDDCTDKHVRKVLKFIEKNYIGILKREYITHSPTLKQRIGHSVGIQQLIAYRKIGHPPRKWNAPFVDF